MTNKEQLEWLQREQDAGKIGRVGAADVNLDGVVESLSGEDALAALSAMGEDELGASLSVEAEAQGDGDPGEDPTAASSSSGGGDASPDADAETEVQPARTGERPPEAS